MQKTALAILLAASALLAQPKASPEKEASMKADLAGQIDAMKKQAQVMVDSVFSFGELGFQEFETSKYLTGILEKDGFKIERGVAGIPTAWVATWGSGKPVISLGSRHRRHPAGVAEARRRLARPDDRGRARPRRRPQLGRAAEHRRRARGEEGDGARAPRRHHPALAGRRRGAGRHEGLLRARRPVQGRRRLPLHARRRQPGRVSWGASANQNGLVVGRVHVSRARARTPPARRGAAAARSTRSS